MGRKRERRKIERRETAELVTFTDTKCRAGNTNVVGNFASFWNVLRYFYIGSYIILAV